MVMRYLPIFILILAVLGCGLFSSNDNANQSNKSNDQKMKERLDALKVEKRSQPLPASEVQISSVSGSETGSTTAGSTLETSQVKGSELEVSRTLSELNATETDEGIIINLPENILFDFDKAEIKPQAEPTLKKISELLAFYKDSPMKIGGHTDSKGADDYNKKLSERRAEAVKKYLTDKFNADESRLKAEGFGETKPVAENEKPDGSDNPEGRQKNRRVEVVIANAKKPQTENN